MNRPVIGITPAHNLDNDDIYLRPTYLRAIKAAGGLPLLLPLETDREDILQILSLCSGILFSGGPDLHPFLWGEETHSMCGNMSPARDRMELALLKAAIEAEKPIFGICRGCQIINVGLGGSLIQDIPSQTAPDFPIAHRQPFDYHFPSHHVRVKEGSLLARLTEIFKNTNSGTAGSSAAAHTEDMAHSTVAPGHLAVNSMHHQAIGRLAPGLSASAEAPDGIIEAAEMPGYPFLLGVQWHPEYLWETDPAAAGIFRGFVRACE